MTAESFEIVEYRDSNCPDLGQLEALANTEGHAFVARTRQEWLDGTNCFDRPGEAFFLALHDTRVIAMCGLNIDPYVDSATVGRLRHMYSHPDFRRQGVAEALVRGCQRHGADRFERIRLRTVNPAADALYRSLGFQPVNEPEATHSWRPEQPAVRSGSGLPPVG